jgi:hypothetical protein
MLTGQSLRLSLISALTRLEPIRIWPDGAEGCKQATKKGTFGPLLPVGRSKSAEDQSQT